MPVIDGSATPESLLPRSDSKNPATTCKGITSNGRPCRRSLAASSRSLRSTTNNGRGVLAVVPGIGANNENAAAYFCWQHKDQAAKLETQVGNAQLVELKERNSIDTLVNRLGVLEVDDSRQQRAKKKTEQKSNVGMIRRDTLPERWQQLSGPLMTIPDNPEGLSGQASNPRIRHGRRRGDIHLSFFCCMRATPSDEGLPPARHRSSQASMHDGGQQRHSTVQHRPLSNSRLPTQMTTTSQRPSYLSLIPDHLSPGITSLLLSELAKPLTPSDYEPGYIYIFWLTPSTVPQAAASTASSLLNPHTKSPRARNSRRPSDVLREFAEEPEDTHDSSSVGGIPGAPPPVQAKTIMLKIGRASNVHRRMNEWTRQCGQHITLLRYYPSPNHHSPSPSPSPSPRQSPARPHPPSPRPSTNASTSLAPAPSAPCKAPLIPRVERLIHLELQDKRVKRSCTGCGKGHREWFEVAPSRKAIQMIDDCVKRWVGWALQESPGH